MTQGVAGQSADVGELRAAGADQAFLLDRDAAWIVRSGRIDVFAVPMRDGHAIGGRQHLLRVDVGRALFGSALPAGADGSTGTIALLAAGNPGTTVQALTPDAFDAQRATYADAIPAETLLDHWMEAVCHGIVRSAVPEECEEVEPGASATLGRGEAVRPAHGTGWLSHQGAGALLVGSDALPIAPAALVPLSHAAWTTLTGKGTVQVRATADVLAAGEHWSGLATLHVLLLRHAAASAARGHRAERTRLARKQAAIRSTLANTFSRITATLGAPSSKLLAMRQRESADDSPDDALLAAFRLVATAAGLPAKLGSGTIAGATLHDKVRTLARIGRLRVRQVALRGDWWTSDGGPLLGETQEEHHPVALIPRSQGGYVLCDPVRRTSLRVTAESACGLTVFAHTFTRSFPQDALTLGSVLRFGMRGCARDVRLVIAMGISAGVLGMLIPLLTGIVFNSVIPGAARGQLFELMLILIVSAVATALFTMMRSLALLRIEGRMGAAIQAAVWDRLLALPLPFFRDYTAGDLASRAMGIEEIRQVLSGATVTAVFSGILSLFNFGLLFYYDSSLAIWGSGIIAVSVIFTAIVSYVQRRDQREIAFVRNRTAGLVLQLLTSISKLRVAAAEVQAFALWVRQFSHQRQLQFRVRAIGNAFAVFNAVLPVLASMVLFGVVAARGDAAALRTGDFIAFLTAFSLCLVAMLSTGTAVIGALTIIPAYENAQPILAAAPEVDEAKTDPGILSGDLELRHIAFRYRPDAPLVLRTLSLHVRRGEYVALVGPSGSGKSTIMRLLLGFERPESGSVQYDGQDLTSIDIQAVRRQIGVVLQSGRLTPGDIFTNIVGSSGASMADAYEAVRMAGMAEDVKQMPMGLHTIVSESGETLSGGQRQRLLIARAIVARPRLLFFDEATSALDNQTQATVSESLAHLRATRIVVAHRLSTILHADRICVVDRGAIVESGTYTELMLQDGLFAALAKRQVA